MPKLEKQGEQLFIFLYDGKEFYRARKSLSFLHSNPNMKESLIYRSGHPPPPQFSSPFSNWWGFYCYHFLEREREREGKYFRESQN